MKQSLLYRLTLYGLVSLLILLLFALMPAYAQAQTRMENSGLTVHAAANKEHVTIIVLDMSGSMATNDPQGLRCSAANAYIDLSGPGSFIGVVGLDSHGDRGGAHNFQKAFVWTQPAEMSTLSARQHLQQTIAQDSHNCSPDSTTPTYDALNQALTMLEAAQANDSQISGSVILLTDGVPSPDTNAQIDAINTELLPQFQAHSWPVDTVALGQDGPIAGMSGTFHSFLGGIADTTSGKFYDDGHGAVPGVSPLNIAQFFVDIFAIRNGRTPGPTIAPTSLSGGTTSRNFQLGSYVDHLDVIVVKDQQSTRVSITTPDGRTLPPQVAGTFVSTSDPHYAIFSIDGPQSGVWQVNVGGSGQFIMDSLIKSSLKVSIIAPSVKPALPLGQDFTVAATIIYQGNPVSGGQFSVTGTISYSGAAGAGTVPVTEPLLLTDTASPGTYQAKVVVPQNAAPGSYSITISASQVSNVAISSDQRLIRLERFPLPYFLSPGTNQVVIGTTNAVATRWDPVLQFIYGSPVGFLQWLGQRPLGGLPGQTDTAMKGVVQLNGVAYPNATVTATATRVGKQDNIPVTIINQSGGFFDAQFNAPSSGTYAVTFKTGGSFEDTHSDFGSTSRTVLLTIQQASLFQEGIAWLWTVIYVLILYLIWRFLRFLFTPGLFGEWVQSEDGEIIARHSFNQSRRGPVSAFRHRNLLSSQDAGMPPGLRFRFNRGNSIEVQARGAGSNYWKRDGNEVLPQFQEVRELVHNPYGDEPGVLDDSDDGPGVYTVLPRQERRPAYDEDEFI